MSFHDHYQEFQRLLKKENCSVCQSLPMTEGMVDIAELPYGWLDAEAVDVLWGKCHLVAKAHVIELYDFNDEDLCGFMRDLARCAKALQKVTGAVKINYEIHGNTVPHLHVHLYPRSLDDPFPNQPIDYRLRRADLYKAGEFDAFVNAMRSELRAGIING